MYTFETYKIGIHVPFCSKVKWHFCRFDKFSTFKFRSFFFIRCYYFHFWCFLYLYNAFKHLIGSFFFLFFWFYSAPANKYGIHKISLKAIFFTWTRWKKITNELSIYGTNILLRIFNYSDFGSRNKKNWHSYVIFLLFLLFKDEEM